MPNRSKRSLPGPLAVPAAFLLVNMILFSAITYPSLGGTPALVTWLKSDPGGLAAFYTILVLTLIFGNLVRRRLADISASAFRLLTDRTASPGTVPGPSREYHQRIGV